MALPEEAWRFVVQELRRREPVAADVGAAAPAEGRDPGAGVPESRGLEMARLLAPRFDGAG